MQQLQSFMRWNCPVSRAPRKKNGAALLSLPAFGEPAAKPQRARQETEVYITLFYKERILETVKQRTAQDGHTGPMINLIRTVARELYEKEDDATCATVVAKLATEAKERNAVEGSVHSLQPTPQQYQE